MEFVFGIVTTQVIFVVFWQSLAVIVLMSELQIILLNTREYSYAYSLISVAL